MCLKNMKTIKCAKCKARFKNRQDRFDSQFENTLCRECLKICKTIRIMIQSIMSDPKLKRRVKFNFDGVTIVKKPTVKDLENIVSLK